MARVSNFFKQMEPKSVQPIDRDPIAKVSFFITKDSKKQFIVNYWFNCTLQPWIKSCPINTFSYHFKSFSVVNLPVLVSHTASTALAGVFCTLLGAPPVGRSLHLCFLFVAVLLPCEISLSLFFLFFFFPSPCALHFSHSSEGSCGEEPTSIFLEHGLVFPHPPLVYIHSLCLNLQVHHFGRRRQKIFRNVLGKYMLRVCLCAYVCVCDTKELGGRCGESAFSAVCPPSLFASLALPLLFITLPFPSHLMS